MLICRFPSLLPYTAPAECDLLCEEFTSYQLLGEKDIPNDVWDAALVHEDDDRDDDDRSTRYYRMESSFQYETTRWIFMFSKAFTNCKINSSNSPFQC